MSSLGHHDFDRIALPPESSGGEAESFRLDGLSCSGILELLDEAIAAHLGDGGDDCEEAGAVGTVKARELANKDDLLFRRNSVTGEIECLANKSAVALNDELHTNN